MNLRPILDVIAADPISPGIPFHPLANLFPLIEGREFDEFCSTIRARGLRKPIILHQSSILDGRNRYRACLATGVMPIFRLFGWPEGAPCPRTVIVAALERRPMAKAACRALPAPLCNSDGTFTVEGLPGDVLAFVLDENLARRHLDESQRAMLAARLATMRQGERTDLAPRAEGEPSANLQKVTQADAAERLHVSVRLVASAKQIVDHGAPELQRLVESGEIAVSSAEIIATLPVAEQIEIVARGEKEILQAAKEIRTARAANKRVARLQKIAEISRGNGALPDRKYNVIYADPAWESEVWSESGMDRAAENHYPTMTLADMAGMGVERISAPDCVLYMWVTTCRLAHGIDLMRAWGFEYVSSHVWDKVHMGMGRWVRDQHEMLLIGTRGNIPAPLPGTQDRSVFTEPRGAHSVKPLHFRQMIERLFPDVPKLEMFCRDAAEGWDVWGNQAGSGGRGAAVNGSAASS